MISRKSIVDGVLKPREKHIESIDESVLLMPLSIAEGDEVNAIEDSSDRLAKLFKLSLRDEDGTQFSDDEIQRIFNNNSARTITEISIAIQEVSGGVEPGEN